jgi:predicted DNA-binding transcriptional regulator AlpA
MTASEVKAWKERELAERLDLSIRTLQAWRLRGVGPRWVKLGASVRYLEPHIIDWLKERGRSR